MLHCLILFTYQKNYHFAHFNYIYIYSGVGCYVQTKNSYLIQPTGQQDRSLYIVPLLLE